MFIFKPELVEIKIKKLILDTILIICYIICKEGIQRYGCPQNNISSYL